VTTAAVIDHFVFASLLSQSPHVIDHYYDIELKRAAGPLMLWKSGLDHACQPVRQNKETQINLFFIASDKKWRYFFPENYQFVARRV
jgi:hypothetical protein